MIASQQEKSLNDLAQSLVVLEGRVYLAQQAFSGRAPEQNHLIEMHHCVRQMIQWFQLVHPSPPAGAGPVSP